MHYCPQRGDIVVIELDSLKKDNSEFGDRHHAICISAYNDDTDVALFCPLTSDKGRQPDKFAIEIPSEFTGKKAWALVRNIKSLDWSARKVITRLT
jgi:mRNA-degrading endonuclease toxin of MazEF toxin-antitoxin module